MKKIIAILVATFFYTASFAHGYWMEVEGSHKANQPVIIKLIFGEFITGERLSGKFLDRMKEISVFVTVNGIQQPISMKQLDTHWEGSFTPQAEGTYTITGINEEREVQDWTKHSLGIVRPMQYLKAVYQVGTAVNQQPYLSSLLDVAITANKKDYTIQVFKNKAAFADAKLTVTDTSGNEKDIILDKDGKATFTLTTKGLHMVDVEWIDKTAGQFKGKEYTSIRYKMDYTVYHQ